MLRLIARLVLLLVAGILLPGEAAARLQLDVRPNVAAEQKLAPGFFDSELALVRLAATLQAAQLQQAKSSDGYELAPGCTQAAETELAPLQQQVLQQQMSGGGLSGGAQRVLGNLAEMADQTVAAAIRARGGTAANVARLETGMGQRTLAEVAEAAARGDSAAIQAIKMVKQAATKGQRY